MSLLAKLWAFIDVVKALLKLWGDIQEQADIDRTKEKLRKQEERKKAIEDIEKATTTDEIWDAQERLVRNKPAQP